MTSHAELFHVSLGGTAGYCKLLTTANIHFLRVEATDAQDLGFKTSVIAHRSVVVLRASVQSFVASAA